MFAQPGFDLANAVVKSFANNDFEILKPYLLNENNIIKAFPKEFKNLSKNEIKKNLSSSHEKVVNTWETIKEYMVENGVDPGKVEVKDVVIYPIIPGKEMLGLIAKYEYEGNIHEDFKLIIAQVDGQTFLLDFPSSTRTITLHTSTRSEFDEAKGKTSIGVYESYEGKLKERVDVLLSTLSVEDPSMFGNFCVYRGEDLSRKWNDRINTYNQDEMQYAVSWKMKLNKALVNCPDYSYEKYLTESESEGTWIVQPLLCPNGSIIYFAFLEIGGELLLGDVDIENQ
jgi:hypothetical protein